MGFRTDVLPVGPERGWRPARGSAPGLLFLLGRGRYTPIHEQPDRVAYRVDTPRGTLFVKHYRPAGVWPAVRDFCLSRKPQRAFARSRELSSRGVSTPAPLGLFLRGRFPPREALFVTEWVEGAVKWAVHLRERVPRGRDPEAFRAALRELGSLVGYLHRTGYYHGDLSSNLLFGSDGRTVRAFVVDLEGLSPRLTRKRRVKNLEELGRAIPSLEEVPLRDRWLYLLAYAHAAGLSRADARTLWREGRAAQIDRMGPARKRMP